MTLDQDRPLFFVHVMKTAGATLRHQMRASLSDDEVYPMRGPAAEQQRHANSSVRALCTIPREQRQKIQLYVGHFPYVATELLGEDVTTLTVLRDPVARTVSMLKHLRIWSGPHKDLSLEQIYDDEVLNAMYLCNHQAKVFAFIRSDEVESYVDPLEVDESRLAIAKAHLEQVDILGLAEHFDELLDELEQRYPRRLNRRLRRNVSQDAPDVTARLLRRIEADNQADLAFYEHARRLYRDRRAAIGGTT